MPPATHPTRWSTSLTEDSVTSVFRITQSYSAQSFRRREDSRDIPNSITIGLKHGVSFRNSLLTDTGLNELLDKEFLRYNDQLDFNDLPYPPSAAPPPTSTLRSQSPSPVAVCPTPSAPPPRSPGVFRPFQLNGHEYVDGAILKNLPTQDVKAMNADVVIAVSIPLQPVGKGDLDSILGVLQRAFSVGIENNEAFERTFANVVVMPDVTGFSGSDYLKTVALAQRGYAAAEANKAALLKYAVTDAQWQTYLARRNAKIRGPASNVLRVDVKAPRTDVRRIVEKNFASLVDQPVDTDEIEKRLSQVRSDGRYDADYTVGYDTDPANAPAAPSSSSPSPTRRPAHPSSMSASTSPRRPAASPVPA